MSLAIIGEFLVGRKLDGGSGGVVLGHCEALLQAMEVEVYENPLVRPPARWSVVIGTEHGHSV